MSIDEQFRFMGFDRTSIFHPVKNSLTFGAYKRTMYFWKSKTKESHEGCLEYIYQRHLRLSTYPVPYDSGGKINIKGLPSALFPKEENIIVISDKDVEIEKSKD